MRRISFENEQDVEAYEAIVRNVDEMHRLHADMAAARTPHDRDALERRVQAVDRKLDRLVYKLYELDEEEVALVEQHTEG